MANLSQGALGRIQTGADVSEPIVQVPVILNSFHPNVGLRSPVVLGEKVLSESVSKTTLLKAAFLIRIRSNRHHFPYIHSNKCGAKLCFSQKI